MKPLVFRGVFVDCYFLQYLHFTISQIQLLLYKGKKLFDNETIPAAFTLIESIGTPGGVIIASYGRAGKVKTSTAGRRNK